MSENTNDLSIFWKNVLETKPFYSDDIAGETQILNQDYGILERENLLIKEADWKKGDNAFNMDLPAEPFVGDLNASIYIITLNPRTDEKEYDNWKNRTLLKLYEDCLKQAKTDYPFYYLNPDIADSGGGVYWRKQKFEGLIAALSEFYGDEELAVKKIAQNVCDLELCAYRSNKWDVGKLDVNKLKVVDVMKKFITDVVIPGVVKGDKVLLVGRGRELLESETFVYNGQIKKFDDLETLFPDRVVFYKGQQCRAMSMTPYGYTKNRAGGTKGGQMLLEKLKQL